MKHRLTFWVMQLAVCAVLAVSAFSHGTPPGKWRTVSGYLVNKTADSTAIETQNGDTLWFTNAGLYWSTGAVLDSALLDSVANGKGRFSGSGGGGTSDSTGIDTNGDGTVDAYLYSTVAGAAHIKKGTNITLTVAGDTVTIAAAGGGGTTDSTRLGNGLAVRTSAADSIAAPTDTLEADTSVMATLGHAENYADSAAGDSARAAAADSIALALRLAGGTMTGDITMTNVDVRNADSLETKVVMLNDGTDSSYITPSGRTYPASVVRWVLGLPAYVMDTVVGSPIGVGNTTSVAFWLPTVDGTNNQVMTTNGSGVLSWSTQTGGGGTGWNWADSAGEPPFWVDSSNHADSANHADAADSSGKALGDAAGNTITSTYETITNVGKIGDDTTNFKTAFGWGDHSAQTYLTEAAGGNPVGDVDIPDGVTINGLGDSTNWNTGYVIANGLDTLARINFSRNFFDTSANGDTLIIKTQSIGVNQLASNAVTSAKIQDGTVASVDIADGTVTGTDIASNTVAGSNILNATISSLKILDQTITKSDIDSTASSVPFSAAYHVTTAVADSAYVTANTVGDSVSVALRLAGGTMTGDINMNNGRITQGGLLSTDSIQVPISGDLITDFTGTGLSLSGAALTADLGTSIVSGEITDGTIEPVDLNQSSKFEFDGAVYHADSTVSDSEYATIGHVASGNIAVSNLFVAGDLEVTGAFEHWNHEANLDLSQLYTTNATSELWIPSYVNDSDISGPFDTLSMQLHPSTLFKPDGWWMAVPTYWLSDTGWRFPNIPKRITPFRADSVQMYYTHWWKGGVEYGFAVASPDSTHKRKDSIKVYYMMVSTPIPNDDLVKYENPMAFFSPNDTAWERWHGFDSLFWEADTTRYTDPGVEDSVTHWMNLPIYDTAYHTGAKHLSDPSLLFADDGNIWMVYRLTQFSVDSVLDTVSLAPDTIKWRVFDSQELWVAKWDSDLKWVGPTKIIDVANETVVSPSWWLSSNGTYHMATIYQAGWREAPRHTAAFKYKYVEANKLQLWTAPKPDSGWALMKDVAQTVVDFHYNQGGTLSKHIYDTIYHVNCAATLTDTSVYKDSTKDLWHPYVLPVGSEELLIISAEADIGTSSGNTRIAIGKSRDGGRNWDMPTSSILTASASGWDEGFLYRASGHIRTIGDRQLLHMYYTGRCETCRTSSNVWSIGVTNIEFLPPTKTDTLVEVLSANFIHGHLEGPGDSVIFGLEGFTASWEPQYGRDSSISASEDDTVLASISALPVGAINLDSVRYTYYRSGAGSKVTDAYVIAQKTNSVMADSVVTTDATDRSSTTWALVNVSVNHPVSAGEQVGVALHNYLSTNGGKVYFGKAEFWISKTVTYPLR